MKEGLAIELQYMEEGEFYLLITNKIDSHGSNNFFFTVNATRSFSTSHKDSLEFANEYLAMLELELAEDDLIEDLFINPFVYFGERIDARKLPEEHPHIDSYLLFFPDMYDDASGTKFQMFECSGVEEVAFQIEEELKMRVGLSIENVVIFRCLDVELVQQIPTEFDETELQREFMGNNMGDFLIPGGLYRIYYGQRSKKKPLKPFPSYRAMILLVNFGGRRVFTYQDLRKEDSSKKKFTYEAIEMQKGCIPERFAIAPRDIVKAVLLKRMKDMREWPFEAVRTYFSRRGVSRIHTDQLYHEGMRLEDVDFARYHVRAALRKRRNQEKLKKKLGKVRSNSSWIEAEYNGIDGMGYITFRLIVGDLQEVNYRFGSDSDIVRVVFSTEAHTVDCFNEDDEVVHRMNPQWSPEMVREALERERARREAESPRNWGGTAGATYSGNWTSSSTST